MTIKLDGLNQITGLQESRIEVKYIDENGKSVEKKLVTQCPSIARKIVKIINEANNPNRQSIQPGQSWHMKLPKAVALTTCLIKSISGDTIVIKNRYAPEGLRYKIDDIEFVEMAN